MVHRLGDVARALTLSREVLALGRDLGSPVTVAIALNGDGVRAGRLLGVAESLRRASGTEITVSQRALQEDAPSASRASLDEQAFASAWAEGRAMTPEQAVAYALDEPASAPAEADMGTAPPGA